MSDSGVISLDMVVRDRVEGDKWTIEAPWLEEPVVADTWLEAYWMALAKRIKR